MKKNKKDPTEEVLKSLNKEEKELLRHFFDELILRASAAYVLWGTKPIADYTACFLTPEEIRDANNEFEKLPQETKDELNKRQVSFPIITEKHWKVWEKVKDQLPMHNFIITTKVWNEPHAPDIVVISITNLIVVLDGNYDLFKQKIGHDFNPTQVAFEYTDGEGNFTEFWEKVYEDEVLKGLIFGYGKKNALFYKHWWEDFYCNQKIKNYPKQLAYWQNVKFICTHLKETVFKKKLSYEEIELPFFSHLPHDPVVEQYKHQRKEIIKAYKGKDSLQITLQKLCE